jgi:hypothetical protein
LLSNKKRATALLINFFGGRKKVTCTVDEISLLTRENNILPIDQVTIILSEISSGILYKKEF